MNLLERLRPGWRSPDPEARLAALRDMGAEDGERLATLARGDPDPRVRRVAIKKLGDPDVLEALVESETDQSLHALVVEHLRDVLVGIASSPGPLADCDAALARLTNLRSLAAVAARGAHESVRRQALARTTGDRALRDVVRNATDAAIRSEALRRIEDPAVLRALATGDCPAEVAVEAVERIADVASLRAIADNRSASKAVRQRARALLGSRADEGPAVGVKEGRARQLELGTTVRGLRALSDLAHAAEQVHAAQREWERIARSVEPRPELAESFAKTCAAILADAASAAGRRTELEQARRAREEGLVARAALCARLEAVEGADTPNAIAEARAAWKALPPLPDDEATALSRRFTLACERSAARHEEWRAREAVRAEARRIVEEAEALADAPAEPPSKTWTALEQRWEACRRRAGTGEGIDVLARRFSEAGARLRERRREGAEQRAGREQENLARLEALCRRLHALATGETLKPSTGRRELQAAEAASRDLGPLPRSEKAQAWSERLAEAREELLRRVAQEEHTEAWRRWANAGAQEEIIQRVESLLESNDLAEGARQLGRLQEEWARVASASPDRARALWERFRSARNDLRRRCDAFLASNLEQKRKLSVEAAALADSSAWNETAERIRRLQAEWKTIGPAPGREARVLWQEFRASCDRFFARRKEHFTHREEERRENAKTRTALCEQAEARADSTDWEATSAVMKDLQARWKQVGAAPREEGEALWQRFRSACDRFFERRSRREELAREGATAEAQTICTDVETLATTLAGEDTPAAEELRAKIDAAWSAWARLDLAAREESLSERVHAAFQRIASRRPESLGGTRLDPAVTRKRREKLCTRLEALLGTEPAAATPTSLQEMALALRERLATNTIAGGADRRTGREPDVKREVERISASWAQLGPPLDDDARALADRFARARARVVAPAK